MTLNDTKIIKSEYNNLVVPLNFYFITPVEKPWYEEHQEEIDSLYDRYNNIDDDNIEDVIKLYDDMLNIHEIHIDILRRDITFICGMKYQFTDELRELMKIITKYKCSDYLINVNIEENEIVNDLQLKYNFNNKINYYYYKKLLILWNDSKEVSSYDEFIENVEACSDWYKVDINGEYDYNDKNYEINMKKIYELPYSFEFKSNAIYLACNNIYSHSVIYINSLCEWMRRKTEILKNDSLEKICIKKMILNGKSDDIPKYLKEKYYYIKFP